MHTQHTSFCRERDFPPKLTIRLFDNVLVSPNNLHTSFCCFALFISSRATTTQHTRWRPGKRMRELYLCRLYTDLLVSEFCRNETLELREMCFGLPSLAAACTSHQKSLSATRNKNSEKKEIKKSTATSPRCRACEKEKS